VEHDARPIANPDVVLREEYDDWAVLFDPETANAVGINPIGVFIWRLLDGTRSIGQIVAEVTASFDQVPGSAPDEVKAFVERLAAGGFIGFVADGARG